MDKLALVVAVCLCAALVGLLLQKRRPPGRGAPVGADGFEAPRLLDRSDFAHPERPWLVAVFSSATCASCADVVAKASALESEAVAVDDVEVGRRAGAHRRYGIEGVPITVVVDADGVVVRSFVGPVSASHLWAAVAEAREPSGLTQGCDGETSRSEPADG